jgi:hypothetical protein
MKDQSQETESGTQDQDEDESHQNQGGQGKANRAGLGILFAWLPKFHRRRFLLALPLPSSPTLD